MPQPIAQARPAPRQEPQQGLLRYILQHGAFIGFLVGLFLLAGWRG